MNGAFQRLLTESNSFSGKLASNYWTAIIGCRENLGRNQLIPHPSEAIAGKVTRRRFFAGATSFEERREAEAQPVERFRRRIWNAGAWIDLARLPLLGQRTDFFRGCIWRISAGFRQFPAPNGV
jgi:hypothetical protein